MGALPMNELVWVKTQNVVPLTHEQVGAGQDPTLTPKIGVKSSTDQFGTPL